jgi:Catalase-related immune-responsive
VGDRLLDQCSEPEIRQALVANVLQPVRARFLRRVRLVHNIAAGLAQVSKDETVERSLAHFWAAGPDYGARVEQAVKSQRT